MNSHSALGGLLRRPESGAFLGLIAVLAFFGIFGGLTFLQPAGMASWMNVAANLGVIAIPVGLLMIAGELDISVGAMVPFGAMTVAVLLAARAGSALRAVTRWSTGSMARVISVNSLPYCPALVSSTGRAGSAVGSSQI